MARARCELAAAAALPPAAAAPGGGARRALARRAARRLGAQPPECAAVECPPSRTMRAPNSTRFGARTRPTISGRLTASTSWASARGHLRGLRAPQLHQRRQRRRYEDRYDRARVDAHRGRRGALLQEPFRLHSRCPPNCRRRPSRPTVALEPTGAALSCVAVWVRRPRQGHQHRRGRTRAGAGRRRWVFDASAFVVAQYDDPYTPSGRHNEILLPLSPSACASASV